jgi:GntR family transcriptional regulator
VELLAEREKAPLYQRIAGTLEVRIAERGLAPGSRLPSERELAEAFGASRMTVRQALKDLERRGLVEARVGQGTFVSVPRIDRQSQTLAGFTEQMRGTGRDASSVVLDATIAATDAEAAQALGVPEHTLVSRLVRLRLVDGKPVALERTEIPVALAPGLLDRTDFSTDSLYRVLRQAYGIQPSEAEETVCAALGERRASVALGIPPDTPVLTFTRRTFDASGRAVEYVRSVYRGDTFTLRFKLTVGAGT